MNTDSGRKSRIRFSSILVIALLFAAAAIILLVESSGIHSGRRDFTGKMLTRREMAQTDMSKPVSSTKTCLFLWNSAEETSREAEPQMQQMLRDMRIPVQIVDVSAGSLPDSQELSRYKTVFICMSDVTVLGNAINELCGYVENGGKVMFSLAMTGTDVINTFGSRMGIAASDDNNRVVHGFKFADGFMIGGDDRTYPVSDPYDAARNVSLDSKCRVYATDSRDSTPLIWERNYGKGRFVSANFSYYDKAYRGIYAAAYSLLEDVSVWPVINASSFYLDDFPSPVPRGDSRWIQKFYDMDVGDFYMNVWWPDVLKLSKRYGIHYTGMMIETYSNQVSGRLKRNEDTSNFKYYGNMLLNSGGELGYHGYNHQPLCGPDYHYVEDLGYRKWQNETEMKYSMQELHRFATSTFPNTTFQVYVPPSNVLSDQGRRMIGRGDLPGVRAIASTYLPGGSVYYQEFEVAQDGITETPRIISGCIFDDYTRLTALSELNLHFVNSHFMHPDDLMDPDRGATLGWKVLKRRLNSYLKWLTTSAPQLKMTRGSEMAGQVQRFAALEPESTDNTGSAENIHFAGLVDEGWCMMRFNVGKPGRVSGGSLSHITGSLYLLHVTKPDVIVQIRNR